MANADEVRWQQRFENFTKALTQLNSATDMEDYTELELSGLVKIFEITFELAWKTLKDLLFYEGFEVKSPREVIRKAFEVDYLDEADSEKLLDALESRNRLSHTYDEATAIEAEELIKNRYAPALRRLHSTLNGKLAL